MLYIVSFMSQCLHQCCDNVVQTSAVNTCLALSATGLKHERILTGTMLKQCGMSNAFQ